jgi:hypothetical protein
MEVRGKRNIMLLTRLKLAFNDMRVINLVMIWLIVIDFAIALLRGDLIQFYAEAATHYL